MRGTTRLECTGPAASTCQLHPRASRLESTTSPWAVSSGTWTPGMCACMQYLFTMHLPKDYTSGGIITRGNNIPLGDGTGRITSLKARVREGPFARVLVSSAFIVRACIGGASGYGRGCGQ